MTCENVAIEYWFYDDNDTDESRALVRGFGAAQGASPRILAALPATRPVYVHSEQSHHWSRDLVDHIIEIKNLAIAEFLRSDGEGLLFLDADICVHPNTVQHLWSLNLDIVSEVFWTRFRKDWPYLPNVWDHDNYGFDSSDSILRLRDPGQYQVGGLGALTLVRRAALQRGMTFSRVKNLRFKGEDRHFCVRAAVSSLR